MYLCIHAKQQTILPFSSVGSVSPRPHARLSVAVPPRRIRGVGQHGFRHIGKRCACLRSRCMVRQRHSLLHQRRATRPYADPGYHVLNIPQDAQGHSVVVRRARLRCLYGVGCQHTLLCLLLQEHQLVHIRVVRLCRNYSRDGYWREVVLPVHSPVLRMHGIVRIHYG